VITAMEEEQKQEEQTEGQNKEGRLRSRPIVHRVRRRRTWYRKKIRNRRIILASVVLVVIAAVCWLGPSFFPSTDVEFTDISTTKLPKTHGATPEDLSKMAEKGDSEAQWRLGTLYRSGDGVKQSDIEAVEWFQRAAEQKFVPALTAMGSQYWSGRGVKQDYNKAYFWYDVALASGDENAESHLEDLTNELTQDEVATIHQQAKAWLQAHSCATTASNPQQ
jgi:hypothetical protein